MKNYKYDAIDSINLIDNNEDLREVWSRMKIKWDENLKKELNSFYIGETVKAEFKSGKLYDARVEKINKKTIKIVLTGEDYKDRFKTYNVSPIYLHRDS